MENDSDFEKLILEKIDKGVELTKSELLSLVTEFSYDDQINKEDYVEVTLSIVKIQDRYFSIEWEYYLGKGFPDEVNTEFLSQPVKVSLEKRIEEHERWVDDQGDIVF